MLFRYDFGEKLDITKFDVQAKHYIGKMRNIEYHLVLSNFKLIVNIDTPDHTNSHLVNIRMTALERDSDNEIRNEDLIFPINDVRFQDFKIVKEIWTESGQAIGGWASNSVSATVDRIINIIKIIFKIDGLRIFI